MAKRKLTEKLAAAVEAFKEPEPPAPPSPAPVDDGLIGVFAECEDGSLRPLRVERHFKRQFHVKAEGVTYYHCGTTPEGVWIYREER